MKSPWLVRPLLGELPDGRCEVFPRPLVGLASGHLAVRCAVAAQVAKQQKVVGGGRVSVRGESGAPGGEVVCQERVDRGSARRPGRALDLPRVERYVAQDLADSGTATVDEVVRDLVGL